MNDNKDIDGLAGEYVLGALPAEEREAVARRLASDPELAAAVADWERRLGAMSARVAPLEPPSDVLAGLVANITGNATAGGAGPRGGEVVALRRRLTRWQWASGSLAASIAALGIALGLGAIKPRPNGAPAELAVLLPDKANAAADEPKAAAGAPVVVAAVDRRRGKMAVRQVAGRPPSTGRVYVVWIETRPGDNPVALGALDVGEPETRLKVPASLLDTTLTPRVLVSSEAAGRTVWDRPRGPVLAAGTLEP
jgi:anti-sigma-K factor RskA